MGTSSCLVCNALSNGATAGNDCTIRVDSTANAASFLYDPGYLQLAEPGLGVLYLTIIGGKGTAVLQ